MACMMFAATIVKNVLTPLLAEKYHKLLHFVVRTLTKNLLRGTYNMKCMKSEYGYAVYDNGKM